MIATYITKGRGESLNSLDAKAEGKWPRTHAARLLGVSPKAFIAGLASSGITSCEWHHTGKYATATEFYDVAEIEATPEFWRGAAECYRGKKREAMLAKAAELEAEIAREEKESMRKWYIEKIRRWRNWPVAIECRDTRRNAVRFVAKAFGLKTLNEHDWPDSALKLVFDRAKAMGRNNSAVFAAAEQWKRRVEDAARRRQIEQLRHSRQIDRFNAFCRVAERHGNTKGGNWFFIVRGVKLVKNGRPMHFSAIGLTAEKTAELGWKIVGTPSENQCFVSAKSVLRWLKNARGGN